MNSPSNLIWDRASSVIESLNPEEDLILLSPKKWVTEVASLLSLHFGEEGQSGRCWKIGESSRVSCHSIDEKPPLTIRGGTRIEVLGNGEDLTMDEKGLLLAWRALEAAVP